MKRLLRIYADTSVICGCIDEEFRRDTLPLWRSFQKGDHLLVLSLHTLRELETAPRAVREMLRSVPARHLVVLDDTPEAFSLANAYLAHGIIGQGARSDAIHIALASIARVDVLVSWNFQHIVNLGRIRLFNAVNLEEGYGTLEIRTPKEVVGNAEEV